MTSLSIVVHGKDGEAHLGATIAGIARCGVVPEDVEVLVADGGSDDRSVAIAAEHRDRVAQLVTLTDAGATESARINAGLRASHGDVICVVRYGDALYPGTLGATLRDARLNSAALLVFDLLETDGFRRRLTRAPIGRRNVVHDSAVLLAQSPSGEIVDYLRPAVIAVRRDLVNTGLAGLPGDDRRRWARALLEAGVGLAASDLIGSICRGKVPR